jgi:hypothetical protein
VAEEATHLLQSLTAHTLKAEAEAVVDQEGDAEADSKAPIQIPEEQLMTLMVNILIVNTVAERKNHAKTII